MEFSILRSEFVLLLSLILLSSTILSTVNRLIIQSNSGESWLSNFTGKKHLQLIAFYNTTWMCDGAPFRSSGSRAARPTYATMRSIASLRKVRAWCLTLERELCTARVTRPSRIASYSAHCAGLGDKVAFHWAGNDTSETSATTYSELHRSVCRFAHVLRSKFGVKEGDRVAIYMPMVIELAVAMLACARIGAIHSVVFGGFSAQSLADRILDARHAARSPLFPRALPLLSFSRHTLTHSITRKPLPMNLTLRVYSSYFGSNRFSTSGQFFAQIGNLVVA